MDSDLHGLALGLHVRCTYGVRIVCVLVFVYLIFPGRSSRNWFLAVCPFYCRPMGFGFLNVATNCVADFNPPSVVERYHFLFYLAH